MKKGREKIHRICAAFLCVCMLLSLPGISDIFSVVAAAEQAESFQEKNIITALYPLPEDIKVQTVFMGTDKDELDLPEELTVYLLRESYEQEVEDNEQENTEQENTGETDDIEENSDTEIKKEQDVQPEESNGSEKTDETAVTDSEENSTRESMPSEEQQESAPAQETHTVTMQEYLAENVIPIQTLENTQTEKQEETVTIDGVAWQSEPEYDGNTEGTYIFTAILPDGYMLADGISLPEITVTVKNGIDVIIQALRDRIAALPDAAEYLALEPNVEDEDAYVE